MLTNDFEDLYLSPTTMIYGVVRALWETRDTLMHIKEEAKLNRRKMKATELEAMNQALEVTKLIFAEFEKTSIIHNSKLTSRSRVLPFVVGKIDEKTLDKKD